MSLGVSRGRLCLKWNKVVKTGATWSVRELGCASGEGKDDMGGVLLNGGKPLLIGT